MPNVFEENQEVPIEVKTLSGKVVGMLKIAADGKGWIIDWIDKADSYRSGLLELTTDPITHKVSAVINSRRH